MSKLFKKPEFNQQRGRNGFDISQSRLFSASPGMLLPYYTDFANAGDKYKITPGAFIRTEALKTAAMMNFKIHLDFYFVPFRQMFMFWNEVYNLTWDVHTNFVSAPDSSGHMYLPCFDISDLTLGNFASNTAGLGAAYHEPGKTEAYYNVDNFGLPILYNFRRLFDLFDLGTFKSYKHGKDPSLLFNLFKHLAYHKIFYSYFNNSTWFKNDASLYNIDSFYNVKTLSPGPGSAAFRILSTLHYRPWRIDYFTNVFPSPAFNSSYKNFLQPALDQPELIPTIKKVNPESLVGDSSTQTTEFYKPFENSGVVSVDLGETLGVDNLSVQDIRSMFALDKFLRVTGMSGSHYDQQTYAHLGVNIPSGLNGECYHVGSTEFPLQIADVVATSSTTAEGVGSVIGDVAGKGFARSDGHDTFSFTAPESGVLMGIFSIEPLADYHGYDMLNFFSNTYDFYHPEFENLGLAPRFNAVYSGTPDGNLISTWTYRYSELKTKYDIVSESIYATDKSIWQGNRMDHNLTLFSGSPSSFSLFYINPQYANNIFAMQVPRYVNYTGGSTDGVLSMDNYNNGLNDATLKPSSVYASDNFIVNTFTKCYKTSIMSVHSLPKL